MVCVFLCVNMEKPKRQPMTKHEGKKNCFFSFKRWKQATTNGKKNTKRNEKSVQNKNLPKYEFRNV